MSHSGRAAMALAVASGLAGATAVDAAPLAPSVAVNFAADQPGRTGATSEVTGPAGVLNTVNWNNTTGQSGTASNVVADVAGVSTPTTIAVNYAATVGNWSSTGRGEENNTGTGENGDLMSGYLDTSNTSNVIISTTGLTTQGIPGPFNVYVYVQGGVNGRGGTYNLTSTGGYNVTDSHDTTAAFDGTFVEDTDLAGTTPGSNYLVFRGVPGDFTLTTTPVNGGATLRANVNAIEIVAVPEPATIGLLGLGALGLLARRRRPSP